jgi:O-antigen ligase
MKIIQYITLVIFLWALPTFSLLILGGTIGSAVSYLSFILCIGYFFLSSKGEPLWGFLILGLLYFMISGLVHITDSNDYLMDMSKYFIFIVCGAELVRHTSTKELFIILMFGASTVILHSLFFQAGYGRYSGIYLNPNGAGLVSIIGYCLGYGIKLKPLKLSGQFLFTFAGILTMSRTFIILWLLISVMAAILNRKEMITIGIGAFVLVIVLSVSSVLNLDANRFAALEGLLENKVDEKTISDDSRTATWSLYTDAIVDNVIIGTGYKAMQGTTSDNVGVEVGVHNTYLMVLGESGFIPFLIFVFIYLRLLFKGFTNYLQTHQEYVYVSFVIMIFLLTSHNYFDNYVVLFVSIWLYSKIHSNTPKEEEEANITNETTEAVKALNLNILNKN